MLRIFLSWKVYISFLVFLLLVFVIGTIVYVGSSGTSLSIEYIPFLFNPIFSIFGKIALGFIIFILFNLGICLALRRKPVVLRYFVIVGWIFAILSIGLIVYGFVYSQQEEVTQENVSTAFKPCTITGVEWSNSPNLLTIEYSDRSEYRLTKGVSPTFVDGEISKNRLLCDSDYPVYFNGEPAIKRW